MADQEGVVHRTRRGFVGVVAGVGRLRSHKEKARPEGTLQAELKGSRKELAQARAAGADRRRRQRRERELTEGRHKG